MTRRPTVGLRRTVTVIATLAVLPIALVAGPAAGWTPPAAPTWVPPVGALPSGPAALFVRREPRASGGPVTPTDTVVSGDLAEFSVRLINGVVQVDVEGYDRFRLTFEVGATRELEGFRTYVRSPDPTEPDMTLSHGSRGCVLGNGWVDVSRADLEGDQLVHLELTFESSCQSNPEPWVTHGALRWDVSNPLPIPNPTAAPADLWEPPPGATPTTGNHMYFTGEAKTRVGALGPQVLDRVSVGQPTTGHSQFGETISFAGSNAAGASVYGTLTAGRHRPIVEAGHYGNLAAPRQNPVTGGVNLHEPDRYCTAPEGWFTVDDIRYHLGYLVRLKARVERRCRNHPDQLQVALDWTASPTITRTVPSQGLRRGTVVSFEGVDLLGISQVTVGGLEAVVVRDVFGHIVGYRTPPLPLGNHEVRVTTAAGVAVGTGEAGFTALPDTPLAPATVHTAPGPAQLLVMWDPPTDLGAGTITGIRLDLYRWSNQDAEPPERTMTVGPTDVIALWSGLMPQYQYRVEVTYLSDLGPGETWAQKHTYARIPDVDVTPFDGVPTLVTQQFVDFAGRAPTAKERDAAVASIRTGKVLPEDYVASMRNRPEWGGVRAPATRLYQAYFGRLPDAGGLTYWAGKVRSGTPLARVSATFAASSEFQRTYGTLSNGAFVDLVYRNVLGRAADPSGRAYWTGKLARGTSRGTVMTNFSESPEHVRSTAATVDAVLLYTGMLRRMPTPSEAGRVRARDLAADPRSPSELAASLLRSPTYASRF